MFDICLNNETIVLEGELIQPAKIIINDFSEWMHIPISYWNIESYKDSWKKSIKEGLELGNHAAMITSMYDPKYLNFFFVWFFYFESEQVYIQNSVIFVDEYENFDIHKINKFIKPRETYNEDGIKISEWNISLQDITKFYETL